MSKPIGVGIIGASPERGWASVAHIPALRSLPDFRLTALSTTRHATAEAAGRLFGVETVFDNHQALVAYPAVDLVVVAVKVPHHFELVSAALEAGKAVYCEWPLGNGLEEAEKLAAMARASGVRGFVGLQARAAPAVNYIRDLIRDGYIGRVLSSTLVGSGMNWGPVMEQPNAYTGDVRNGATLLSIPLGHTLDGLCYCLGEVREVAALTRNRVTRFSVAETGEALPMTTPDQILVSATLDGDIPLSIHYRGGVSRGTNLLWEINGSEGDLQISAIGGHMQMFELSVRGARGADTGLADLPVPARYQWAPEQPPPGFSLNVAQAYARLARDLREGSSDCPDFDTGVLRHRSLQAIEQAARTGTRQTL